MTAGIKRFTGGSARLMAVSVARTLTGDPESALAPVRTQADLLIAGMFTFLMLVSLFLAPLHGSWLVVPLGPLAAGLFWVLHRLQPGGATTRIAAGILIQGMVAVIVWQGGARDEPSLLFYVAAAALIIYQDWRCLWPGTAVFSLFMMISGMWDVIDPDMRNRAVGDPPLIDQWLHLAILLAHTGMCSACAGLLRRRSVRAAEITADLEHARREVADELEQRRRIEHELVEAKDRAEALARTKTDFLAIMSHELRTPMNGILGMSRLLAETRLDGEQREMIDAVLLSSDALLEIIGDVLDYSKMEAGRLSIDPVPCDLRRVCEAVLDVISPKAEEKDLALYLRFAPDVHRRVVADAARIRQVLLNLVGNAIKFTAEGAVHLDVSLVADGRIRFAITDTGIGLTPIQIERLFQPFVQAEVGTTRTYGGTGLGLAISKRLVDLMHGAIGVDSAPGSGSTFWCVLSLPADGSATGEFPVSSLRGHGALVIDPHAGRAAALTDLLRGTGLDARAMPGPPDAVDGLLAVLIDEQTPGAAAALERYARDAPLVRRVLLAGIASSRMPLHPGTAVLRKPVHADALFDLLAPGGTRRIQPRTPLPTPPPSRSRGTVLLADDHYVSLHQTESLLHQAGFTVVTAVDGVHALRKAGEHRFDLLVIDAQLPDLDAAQVVMALRTGAGPNRTTPVVAMGGTASSAENLRMVGSGIDEILERPLTPEALGAALARWAERGSPPPV